MIPFNKPYIAGSEIKYLTEAVKSLNISSDGLFTKKCHNYFETNYSFKKTFLTTSCTDALEMSAILLNITEGDEIIAPTYTFVSTVNAFVLRGAKVVFADSAMNTPNIDADRIEELITPQTKAIVAVHYAGIACDIDKIVAIAKKYNLCVVEDAAHAVNSFYKNKPLGSFGHLATLSFHETKNITCGEGGLLIVNDDKLIERAEIIRDKGTNRASFLRGEVESYSWVDIGSSFALSELNAAYLLAQLEKLDLIQDKRMALWNAYYENLKSLEKDGVQLPYVLKEAKHNAHIFFIVCQSKSERDKLMNELYLKGINTCFHYLSLHKSSYYSKQELKQNNFKEADRYSDCLLRLPLYFELKKEEVEGICHQIKLFYA